MALKFLNNGYFASKVGIGVEAPLTNLDILGASDTYLTIRNTGTFKSGIRMYGGSAGISNIWHDDAEPSLPGMHFGASTNIATTPTTQLYIKGSDGNIGIGTTTPNAKLDIQGTQGQLFSVTDDLSGEIFAVSDISGVPIMTVNSSGVSYFDGNVGIGTTSPSQKLDIVGGNLRVNSETGREATLTGFELQFSRNSFNYIYATDSAGSIRIVTGGNAQGSDPTADFKSNKDSIFYGNVGIGTTSPSYPLEIAQAGYGLGVKNLITSTDVANSILAGYYAGTVYLGYGYGSKEVHIGSTNSGDVKIRTLGNTIVENGNVGIGSTSPSASLEVVGSVKIIAMAGNNTYPTPSTKADNLVIENRNQSQGDAGITIFSDNGALGGVYFGDEQSNQVTSIINDNTGGKADLYFTTNGNNERMRITSSGNVGIGTTSPGLQKLHVVGDIKATNKIFVEDSSNSRLEFASSISNQARISAHKSNLGQTLPLLIQAEGIKFGTVGGGEKMRMDSTGNLGINTTSPDFKLDVDGTFGVSDLPGNVTSTSALVRNETIGSEILSNPDFATNTVWGGSSSIANGQLTKTGGGLAYQTYQGLVPGGVYLVEVDVASIAGTANFYLGGTNSSALIVGKQSFYQLGGSSNLLVGFNNGYLGTTGTVFNSVSLKLVTSASDQIQTRQLGTGAFGPTPVGAYLPLAGGTMTGNTDHNDNVYSKYGTADQLRIWNNGSNSYIFNYTSGNINIGNDAVDKDVIFYADRGDGLEDVFFRLDGSETNGTTVLGVTLFPDKSQARFGNQGDLRIYHDGSNSYIQDTGTGTLNLQGSTQVLIGGTNGEVGVQYVENAGVGLRHNNVTKLTTESTGIAVVGDIKIDSALLDLQENTDIDTGAEVVAQVAYATYTAAFFDFVVKKGTNVRSGTVYACHNGDTTPLVEFTETSTNDLGDTSDVVLSVDISGANMRLLATVTSDDWSVKSLIRAI